MRIKLFILLLFSLNLYKGFSQTYRTVNQEKIYVSTDKYFYAPSEKVYYSAFVATDKSNVAISNKIKVWIENSKGDILDSSYFLGSGNKSGHFKLPKKGGIYFVKSLSTSQLNHLNFKPFLKEIFVQNIVKKNFFVKLDIDKNYYVQNDIINLKIALKSAGNKTCGLMECNVLLKIDGQTFSTSQVTTDINGKTKVNIQLPNKLLTNKNISVQVFTTYRGSQYSNIKKIKVQKPTIIAQVFYEHGNAGYFTNKENKIIVKTTDEFGNYLDIKGKLVSTSGNVVEIIPFAKGLATAIFIADPNNKYVLVYGSDTLVDLFPAASPMGFSVNKADGFKLQLTTIPTEKLRWIITKKDKVLLDLITVFQSSFTMPRNLSPGIISSVLIRNNQIIAQRNYFVGYENIQYGTIKCKNTFELNKVNDIVFEHPENKKAIFSIAVINENNNRQIKDKSHHSVSWLLLGSEYNTEIEEAQFYFDKKEEKSAMALDLLMNTLHNNWTRDIFSGLVKAKPNVKFTAPLVLKGTIYNADNDIANNAKVYIKNTSIKTRTDSTGKFRLIVPQSMVSNLKLIIKKGFEKMVYKVNEQLANNIFIAEKKLGEYAPIQALTFNELNKYDPFNKPKKTVRMEDNIIIGSLLKRMPGLSFSGSRVDGTNIFIDGVRVVGRKRNIGNAYTSAAPTSNYSMNYITGRGSSRQEFNWDYINGYYQPTYFIYQEPFRVKLQTFRTNNKKRNHSGYVSKSTVYWSSENKMDKNGKHKIKQLSNIPQGGYRILAEGVDEDGEPFYAEKYVLVKDKFEVETNLPSQLFVGDEIIIPVKITNNFDVENTATVWVSTTQKWDTISFRPNETKILFYKFNNTYKAITKIISILIRSKNFRFDTRKNVVVKKFRIQKSMNISGDSVAEKVFIKSFAEENTIQAEFKIYTNFEERLLETARKMLRQPSGCFEQVSSSNYPNILVLLMMQQGKSKNNKYLSKAKQYLNIGYSKLANYETPQGGFEWYGRNPPHESLTAYGLLQFSLMKEAGVKIDNEMFDRNMAWLWKRRDNKGGFKFHRGKYGFGGATYEVNNAYITWVLSRVSNYTLDNQIDLIKKDLEKGFDAYKMAMLVNILYNKNRTDEANLYHQQLKNHITQQDFKEFKAKKSVMNSYGNTLDIEVMALTLMANLNTKDLVFSMQLKSKLLGKENSRGYFGNTQSTALTLEALVRLGSFNKPKSKKVFTIFINGIKKYEINPDTINGNRISINTSYFNLPKNTIRIVANNSQSTFNFNIKWVEKRENLIDKDLLLSVKYAKDKVAISEYNTLAVNIKNTKTTAMGQVVASISIPDAYALNTDELRDLGRKGIFDYYEIIGNKLNFYFLGIKPQQSINFNLNLKAVYAGSFHSDTHQVFEYYHPSTSSHIVSKLLKITTAQ